MTMHANEVSLLSDDLRPRDTPNHTLLKDVDFLKPLVPDLSILDDPQEDPVFHNRCQQPIFVQENTHSRVPNRQNPFVEECKLYSDYRRKCATSAKPQSTAYSHHDNSNSCFISGKSSPTVLDNLNPLADRSSSSTLGRHPARPLMVNCKDSHISGTTLKVSHNSERNSLEASTVPLNSQRSDSQCYLNSGEASQRAVSASVGSRESSLGKANNIAPDHSQRQLVTYQSDIPNCIGCAHWPHQTMSAVNCNSVPMFHPYAHQGIPACNTMPIQPNSAPPANRTEPYQKSRSVSTNPGTSPGKTFSDTVVYDNLYQMVLSQSEQLKLLQTQVEKLLICQENLSQSGSPRAPGVNQNRRCTIVVERGTQTSDNELERDKCAKMSIGVMTTSLTRTVAYTGRVGHIDSRNGVTNQPNRYIAVESRNKLQNGHCQSTSSSPSTQALPSSCLRSDLQLSQTSGSHNNCCKHPDCVSNDTRNERSRKSSKLDRVTQMDRLAQDLGNKAPGVSAAIQTVRGCQAALQSQSLPTDCELAAGVNESLTLNGAEIPRYSSLVEQRMTPPPSLHLVVEEFSDQDGSESDDEGSYSSDTVSDDSYSQSEGLNRLNLRDNMPLGVSARNNFVSEDSGDDIHRRGHSSGKISRKGRKQKENRPPRSIANVAQKRVSFQHESKFPEENPGDDFKTVALKFLRENYPEELVSSVGLPGSKSSVTHRRVNEMAVYGRKNNMSYATFDYLRRYDLLPEVEYKTSRTEELPGYNEDVPPRSTGVMNGSPSQGRYGYAVASHFAQHVNTEQYGMGVVKGRDLTAKDHPGRTLFKEKHLPAHSESRGARKPSSKRRHKNYQLQADPTHRSHPNTQQSSPIHNVLDMTALCDQGKLPYNM